MDNNKELLTQLLRTEFESQLDKLAEANFEENEIFTVNVSVSKTTMENAALREQNKVLRTLVEKLTAKLKGEDCDKSQPEEA